MSAPKSAARMFWESTYSNAELLIATESEFCLYLYFILSIWFGLGDMQAMRTILGVRPCRLYEYSDNKTADFPSEACMNKQLKPKLIQMFKAFSFDI